MFTLLAAFHRRCTIVMIGRGKTKTKQKQKQNKQIANGRTSGLRAAGNAIM
jgi:hypothetical protein